MAIQNTTQATQTVQHAATLLAGLDWIDQDMARQLSPMAEAVANMFTLVYYQAETGRLTQADFQEAMTTVRQALQRA
ncbi:type I toxin-antitoxin system ptaRNA1 family toxin [Bordetella petrii]|uniref:type I toxin-antitoxin system ptaRNA1 family toxin n=1 Tax=Bordetella petrii TaxID=94624 RepID=UPI001E5A3ACB|nr:type I toxin-antitoxin system ptaRNA1 family toxin [Bordetella petrii]MCD0502133.1 type I toxin-antitoxin system ptaRNA1 family toxin [Bordetella petrii]